MEDALLQTESHSFVDCVFWRLLAVLCSILFHLLAPSSPVVPLQTPEGAECLVYPSERRPAHAHSQLRCLDRRLSDTKHDINILAHVFCASLVSEGFFHYLFFLYYLIITSTVFKTKTAKHTRGENQMKQGIEKQRYKGIE